MPPSILEFILLGILVLHIAGSILLIRNFRFLNYEKCNPGERFDLPDITVIIPARNEELDLGRTLESLGQQSYPNIQIIIVNDHSSDSTGEIADSYSENYSNIQVLHNPEKRAGWLGKHDAIQTALERVRSSHVLFTDADVFFHENCIAESIRYLQKHHLDMLSLLPRFSYVSFCETMTVPMYIGGTAFLLNPDIENPKSNHALAAGAFILTKRDILKKLGDFDSIKSNILDDVSLARLFKKNGYNISLKSAPCDLKVRLFKGNRHAFSGSTKHFIGILEDYIWVAPFIALAPLLVYGLMIFGIVFGLLQGKYDLLVYGAASLCINYCALLLSRKYHKFNLAFFFFMPLMSVQYAISGMKATFLLISKGEFHWRGRTSQMDASKK